MRRVLSLGIALMSLGACGSNAQDAAAGADGGGATTGLGRDAVVIADGLTETAAPCTTSVANCPGAPHPAWKLLDFQPKSPKFHQIYGQEGFEGRVTVVALLAGW